MDTEVGTILTEVEVKEKKDKRWWTENVLWVSCVLLPKKDDSGVTIGLVKRVVQGPKRYLASELRRKLSPTRWQKQKRKLKKIKRRLEIARRMHDKLDRDRERREEHTVEPKSPNV